MFWNWLIKLWYRCFWLKTFDKNVTKFFKKLSNFRISSISRTLKTFFQILINFSPRKVTKLWIKHLVATCIFTFISWRFLLKEKLFYIDRKFFNLLWTYKMSERWRKVHRCWAMEKLWNILSFSLSWKFLWNLQQAETTSIALNWQQISNNI